LAKKPEILYEPRFVVYDDIQWAQLKKLRERALRIINGLEAEGVRSYAYGSIARGDVHKSSDIDIIVPYPVSSYKLEIVLGKSLRRELVQATPSMVLKGHIILETDLVVTFPLFKLMPREEEFYHWGGLVNRRDLEKEIRVSGVDKRLLLVEPTETGHKESGVIGYEHEVAKKVGVSIAIAQERVRVLTRRDNVGRTGVYLTRVLTDDESFEEVAKMLKDTDPALRRTIERRES
jgi:predicted nucleotidyltransferase